MKKIPFQNKIVLFVIVLLVICASGCTNKEEAEKIKVLILPKLEIG